MSDKMRMQAVDKTTVRAAIKVISKVKIERCAKQAGIEVGTLLAAFIEEHAATIETTPEDLVRMNEIISENIRKRDEQKAAKGVR